MSPTEVYLAQAQARARLARLEQEAAQLPPDERARAEHILAEFSLALTMLEVTEQELAAQRGHGGGPHLRRRRR